MSLPEPREDPSRGPADASAVVAAVREDIRQTLRIGWLGPAVDEVSRYPVFLTAAWSTVRPNVGKSFLLLSRAIRTASAESVRTLVDVPDLRKQEGTLSPEELRRICESARAAHLAAAKMQIVVHAFHRLSRRERVPGTGREEPPMRRGVPEWQRWMVIQQAQGPSLTVLERAREVLSTPALPAPLGLFARWPETLAGLWAEIEPLTTTGEWASAARRLRRVAHSGLTQLPHPIGLQWAALRQRGFGEADRAALSEKLADYDAAMPGQTLAAAFAWLAFGAPDVGPDL